MAAVNDIVLIYLEDAPMFFARVESIVPDDKKDWFHIKLLMLNIPLQVVTWILKGDYINGSEFHMNGQKMKLEKVVAPVEDLSFKKNQTLSDKKVVKDKSDKKKAPSKIISFSDFKKHEPESG